MTLALLCSGQGRQSRHMFEKFATAPAAAPILAEASALLGDNVLAVLSRTDDDLLFANRASQVLCVAHGLAAAACLEPTGPILIAGYSVGEMTAWGVAGLWSSSTTLRLTAARAEVMDAAGNPDDQLGFVRGLSRERVEALVAGCACAIAIVNPNQLFVIGGARVDVERCCEAALSLGAVSARPISVRIASHTARLAAAVGPLREILRKSDPGIPLPGRTLIGTATASVIRGAQGVDGLAAQVDTVVEWATTLETLVERGCERMLELGPGSALADMVRGAYSHIDARAIDDFRTLNGVAAWLAS